MNYFVLFAQRVLSVIIKLVVKTSRVILAKLQISIFAGRKMQLGPTNLRVYGILLREGRVLVSIECILGRNVVKFPGGGVEEGETPEAALAREFVEEGNLAIKLNYLVYAPGTLFSPWTHSRYTPLYYRIDSEGIPNTPEHEHVDLQFMCPEKAIGTGKMAEPEIFALKLVVKNL